jgi:uncharacterized protein YebE (UPF0316 family)
MNEWFALPEDPILMPMLIFCARILDVSIGTVRLICVTRGRKRVAVVLGFFEVLIWTFAISSMFSHLNRWPNIFAYAAGFATGNAVGMWLEKRLAMGVQIVQLISRGAAHAVAARLRFADYCVTGLSGQGRDGPVAICLAIVPRRSAAAVIRMAREIDPGVIATVEDASEFTLGSGVGQLPGKLPWLPLGRRRMTPPIAIAPEIRNVEPAAGVELAAGGLDGPVRRDVA